jgi:hypothetical protein
MEHDELAIYERLPHEPPRAFRAFCIYRDAGPTRSLKLVDETLRPEKRLQKGKKRATICGVINRWSTKYLWVERATAYDVHVDRERRRVREEEILEAERVGLELGKKVAEKASRCLDALQPATVTIEEGTDDQGRVQIIRILKANITAQGIAALAKVGVELQRLSLGLAKERHGHDRQELIEQVERELERVAGGYYPAVPKPALGASEPPALGAPDPDAVDPGTSAD